MIRSLGELPFTWAAQVTEELVLREGAGVVGLRYPPGFAAGDITIEVKLSDNNWALLYDTTGVAVKVTVIAGAKAVEIPADFIKSVERFRLKSSVNQTGAGTVITKVLQ